MSVLRVSATGQCYVSVLRVSATCQCYASVLRVNATSQCYASVLSVSATCQCYVLVLRVSATSQCYVSVLVSVPHVSASCQRMEAPSHVCKSHATIATVSVVGFMGASRTRLPLFFSQGMISSWVQVARDFSNCMSCGFHECKSHAAITLSQEMTVLFRVFQLWVSWVHTIGFVKRCCREDRTNVFVNVHESLAKVGLRIANKS